jgi:hypothetical protein
MWPKMAKTRSKKPARYAAIKQLALSFPGVREQGHRHGPWFVVGKKAFALYWDKEELWILKLPSHQVMMLIEVRPEVFRPMKSRSMLWIYVDVEKLDRAELRDYLTAAWRSVAPRKIASEFLQEEKRP